MLIVLKLIRKETTGLVEPFNLLYLHFLALQSVQRNNVTHEDFPLHQFNSTHYCLPTA